jgi:hypothetical protein
VGDSKEHTQRLAPEAWPEAPNGRTRRTRLLATICTRQNQTKAGPRLIACHSTLMPKVLGTGAATVKRGGSVRSGLCGGHSGARPATGVGGKGGALLLVDDADVVLDAISFQGVS